MHNQTPLHVTLSKLVFTSHCICFCYKMIFPASSAYTIGVVLFAWPRYIGCWPWTGRCSCYLFPALFANQILICFMSAAHLSPVFTGHCFGFIVSGTCTLELFFSIILVQWLLLWTIHRFDTFIFRLGTVYLHHFR